MGQNYYNKSEADEKFITEETVNNLINLNIVKQVVEKDPNGNYITVNYTKKPKFIIYNGSLDRRGSSVPCMIFSDGSYGLSMVTDNSGTIVQAKVSLYSTLAYIYPPEGYSYIINRGNIILFC